MNKKLIIILAGLGVLIFAVAAMLFFINLKEDTPRRPPVEKIRAVNAEPIRYSNHTTEIFASGRVVSREEIVLSAEVSGKIEAGDIPFKTGQSFKKGDLLIRIYDKEAILDLKAKKSAFLNMTASILPDIKVSYAESYDTWVKFFESINIDQDFPELPEIRSAQEKVFLASRNLLTDYYSIKSSELRLRKHYLHAPFDGAFTDVRMEVGAIANPGSQLAQIINTRELELEVPVEVDEAKWINTGDVVKIINRNNNTSWRGTVKRKSKDVDPATHSIIVFVSMQSTERKPVYKGQYLTAEFSGIKLNHVMEIPRGAVFNTDEVFIVKDSLLVKQSISIQKINQETLYFNGLDEGMDIVVEPLINASENTKVRIIGRTEEDEKIKDADQSA
jgi:multidrug efflux pump subunit AcrA (membrane-fusion protein)